MRFASLREEMDIMKSGIGSFVLRFAAMAVLIALATAAQAQGTSQSVCQYVWDPVLFKRLRVCNEVYYPPPPPPAQAAPAAEPAVRHTTGARARPYPMISLRRREKLSCEPPSARTDQVQICARHPTG